MSRNVDIIDIKPTLVGDILYPDTFSATGYPIGLLLCLTYA